MKLRILAILMLSIGSIAFLPALSTAIPLPIGDPIPGNSWAQAFIENGVGPFDKMEAFMISGGPFEANGFESFSAGGWNGLLINPNYILATGPAVTDNTFNIQFFGSSGTPLTFDFFAYNDSILLDRAHAVWNGGGWAITPLSKDPNDPNYDRTPVPEPGILILLGIAMVSVAAARRKFKG